MFNCRNGYVRCNFLLRLHDWRLAFCSIKVRTLNPNSEGTSKNNNIKYYVCLNSNLVLPFFEVWHEPLIELSEGKNSSMTTFHWSVDVSRSPDLDLIDVIHYSLFSKLGGRKQVALCNMCVWNILTSALKIYTYVFFCASKPDLALEDHWKPQCSLSIRTRFFARE